MSTIQRSDSGIHHPTAITPHISPERVAGASLPLSLTTFIGREREVAEVGRLLCRDDVRLLSLIGPGGVGKTRLALKMAHEVTGSFADGTTFVPLAAFRDPALVLPAIAQGVGAHASGGRPTIESLVAFLQWKKLLLVLDNVEQVLDAGPKVAEILTACSGLTALVTSREPLHLSGEHIVRVQPLALPNPGSMPPIEQLTRYEGIALFVERARAAESDFHLTTANADTVAVICQRLDGLPLAIELAAARINYLPPEALLPRLERRLPLLLGGPRDQPARLRTMRDAIGWSHDLLTAEEQVLFRRLSVLAGGFTLEAAQAVADRTMNTGCNVLEGVASLVDKSLVQRLPISKGTEPRFGMLETIREYALERLAASGEEWVVRQDHASYVAALAERFWDALPLPEADHWMQRLQPEIDNLRATLNWTLAHAPSEALQLVGALEEYWIRYGHFTEGRDWVERALMASATVPSLYRARALMIAGWLAIEQDDLFQAEIHLTEALECSRDVVDQRFLTTCFAHLGGIARKRGELERARQLHEQERDHAQLTGDPVYVAVATLNLGQVAMAAGHLSRAEDLLEQALAIHRSGSAPFGSVVAQYFLGRVSLAQGDRAKALRYLQASVHAFADAGDLANVARSLEGLAGATANSQAKSATNLLGAATEIRKRVGRPLAQEDGPTYEQTVQAARAGLGEGAYDAAWQVGSRFSWDEILSEVDALAVPSAERHVSSPSKERKSHGLTQRELEVLHLLAEGRTDREIAEALNLSYRTVTSYVRNILTKLNVKSRTAAATQVVRHGLI